MKKRTVKPWENGKVEVSDNGHYLQHENGKPFFWLADTGWLLFMRLNRMEVEHYLDHRGRNGYNVIQAMVIHGMPESNIYGNSAFHGDDFTRPVLDEDDMYNYWKNIDYVITEAYRRGLYLALVPVWGSVVKAGYLNENSARIYGKWLADRYRDAPNIFWLNGGDVKGNVKPAVWQALGRAIKEHDPQHLMTFHPFGRRQSSSWFHQEDWLDFNMFQSGHRRYDQIQDEPVEIWKGEDNWRYVREDLNKKPAKPTLDGEPSYEGIPQGLHDPEEPYWQEEDCRRYAYWSVMAGACGHTYGHSAIMQMHKPALDEGGYGVDRYWYQALEESGGLQMKYLKRLILSRPYFSRENDQSLVAGDEGERYDRILVSRGPDYVFAYIYTGRAFGIKLGEISGTKVKAWWFNPKDASRIYIGEYKNSGAQEFDPPGQKRDGNDWILVLDDINSDYDEPGLVRSGL